MLTTWQTFFALLHMGRNYHYFPFQFCSQLEK